MTSVTALTNSARRVLAALREIAGGSQEADTSWKDLQHITCLSRGSISGAIRELKGAQAIQRVGENGRTVRYMLLTRPVEPPDAPEAAETQASETFCTGIDRSRPVQSPRASKSDSDSESDDDEALAQKRNQIARLLCEYLIEEPTRSRLVELLVPFSESELRAICERTRAETIWRNPAGVTVKRLLAHTQGQQDPLPVFATAMAAPSARPSRPAGRPRKAALTRRPQIQYTDQQRDAARQTAARRIAERAARKLMHGASA